MYIDLLCRRAFFRSPPSCFAGCLFRCVSRPVCLPLVWFFVWLSAATAAAACYRPQLPPSVPVIFSKCPFRRPSDSAFDAAVADVIPPNAPVVSKPNTNILHDPAFSEWVESCVLARGVNNLVVGGCTTTSCVRVSSSAVQRKFGSRGLQVWVVLDLCGARLTNYTPRCHDCFRRYMDFGWDGTCESCTVSEASGLTSPVQKAQQDMEQAGVKVLQSWPDQFLLGPDTD